MNRSTAEARRERERRKRAGNAARTALPIAIATCMSLAACAPRPADPSGAAGTIAVTNALIIDGLGGEPVADGVIVIEDARIREVGSAEEVSVPPGARVIDAAGGAVMPGLSDMHVHLVGGWDGASTDMLGYRRYLNALLYAGVTTVFDVGNVLPYVQQIRAEVAAGRLAGPRIYLVGPLVDGPTPLWPPLTYTARDAGSVRGLVEQLAGARVDALKGYVGLTAQMVDSLVRAGADHDLPVVVDLGFNGAYSAAVRSGVTARAHAPTGPWSDDDLTAMAQRGTASITTLAVLESFARRRLRNLSFLNHPLIASTSPPWFLEALRTEAERTLSPEESQRAEAVGAALESAMRSVKRMHDAGVLLVAGTDAPYPGVVQGEGVHRELELLVEAGLTPLEAITAATRNAATLMGAADEWGALTPGLAADLVVLRGNPLDGIAETRDIVAVIQNGVVLDRGSLTFEAQDDPGFRTVGSVAAN